jgi:hypothetical protein
MSLLFSVVSLVLERLAGIDWDYHPDSVTYATTSKDILYTILESGDVFSVLNNGYYIVCALLDESIYAITLANMILFSLTNVILSGVHYENAPRKNFYLLAFLIFNPYRLHLSTTLLKDSFVIYLTVIFFFGKFGNALSFLSLVVVRVASLLYVMLYVNKKHLYWMFLIALCVFLFNGDLLNRVIDFNDSDMSFRDYNQIPSFQNIGVFGILLRAIVWPVITITGIFFLLSPSIMFFPLAIGAVLQIIYVKKQFGKMVFPIGGLVALSIFAILVTGYTSYLRYIFPILTIAPFFSIKNKVN